MGEAHQNACLLGSRLKTSRCKGKADRTNACRIKLHPYNQKLTFPLKTKSSESSDHINHAKGFQAQELPCRNLGGFSASQHTVASSLTRHIYLLRVRYLSYWLTSSYSLLPFPNIPPQWQESDAWRLVWRKFRQSWMPFSRMLTATVVVRCQRRRLVSEVLGCS